MAIKSGWRVLVAGVLAAAAVAWPSVSTSALAAGPRAIAATAVPGWRVLATGRLPGASLVAVTALSASTAPDSPVGSFDTLHRCPFQCSMTGLPIEGAAPPPAQAFARLSAVTATRVAPGSLPVASTRQPGTAVAAVARGPAASAEVETDAHATAAAH